MFNPLFVSLQAVSRALNLLSGLALTLMMLLTVTDVVCRAGGHPILGVYEIAALGLAVVIGCGFPQTSLDRGHVYMEFLLEKLSGAPRRILNTLTRLGAFVLFILIGYNLLKVGAELYSAGEVSPTLRLPFYPVAYLVAVCCFVQCLVFLADVVRIWRGEYE
ncbi:MAG: TRAP transporter small permease [Deltaproteobacteria bacterium]|nr:TRAP transporter small permease [Deltaproteobacteria bacterium]